MKVKEVLELIGDKYSVIEVNDQMYECNLICGKNDIKRCKGIFSHYKTSKEEVNEVLNKEVKEICSRVKGVTTIVAKEKIQDTEQVWVIE